MRLVEIEGVYVNPEQVVFVRPFQGADVLTADRRSEIVATNGTQYFDLEAVQVAEALTRFFRHEDGRPE